MFDSALHARLQPLLVRAAAVLVRAGVGADAITLVGFAIGIGAAITIAFGATLAGLLLMLLSRLMDGLDGAVARASTPSDRGGFLDITLDFLFYASIPLAFALLDPERNALPAAVLLASFIGTGSSFLAFAIIATKRGLVSLAFPGKGFYYLGGLTEAAETLVAFAAMCVWPQWFPELAFGFAALCLLTTVLRIGWGWRRFD